MQQVSALFRGVNWPLTAILIAGLALRVLPSAAVPDSARTLIGDEPGYASLGRDLLTGEGYDWPGRVPVYPAFLAGSFLIFGESYYRLRLVQCVIGLIPIWLTYRLGRRLFGRRAGLVAALLVAVSCPLMLQPKHVLSENLFTPMVLIVVWLTVDALEWATPRRFAVLGIAIGFSDLIRPTLFLYPAFLCLALFMWMRPKEAVRLGTALVLGAGLTVLPWTIHNYVRWHALIPLQTSSAAIWQASPEYQRILNEKGYAYVWTQVLYGPGWKAHDPGSVAGDRYWTRRGIDSIRAEPWEYLKLCAKRVINYWVGDPIVDWNRHFPLDVRGLTSAGYRRSEAVLLTAARATPLLAMMAAVVLWRKRMRYPAIAALLIFVTLFHAATIAVIRLSEPFLPLLLIVIAATFDRLTQTQPEAAGQQAKFARAAVETGSVE